MMWSKHLTVLATRLTRYVKFALECLYTGLHRHLPRVYLQFLFNFGQQIILSVLDKDTRNPGNTTQPQGPVCLHGNWIHRNLGQMRSNSDCYIGEGGGYKVVAAQMQPLLSIGFNYYLLGWWWAFTFPSPFDSFSIRGEIIWWSILEIHIFFLYNFNQF